MDSLFMLAAKKTHPCYSKDILVSLDEHESGMRPSFREDE